MSVTNKIKGLLQIQGRKNTELAAHLGITNQSLANKFNRGSFSGEDLIKVADFLNCELAFILPDKQRVTLTTDDLREANE